MHNVGFRYRKGLGVEEDLAAAKYWYEQGAENNYVPAIAGLGYLHAEGIGVDVDLVKAEAHYREAAWLDDDLAQNNLGDLLWEKLKPNSRYVEAYAWLLVASDQGLDEIVADNLENIVKEMTEAQIREGEKEAERIRAELESRN